MKDKPFRNTLIKSKKWDKANWVSIVYLFGNSEVDPPILGLIFKKLSAGNEIFKDWIEKLGHVDQYEVIRVSIIEGEMPDQIPGYSIVIGSNVEGEIKRLKEKNIDVDPRYVSGKRQVHRSPNSESIRLANFKRSFQKHKKYLLMPVHSPDLDLKQMNPQFELNILKREIHYQLLCERA